MSKNKKGGNRQHLILKLLLLTFLVAIIFAASFIASYLLLQPSVWVALVISLSSGLLIGAVVSWPISIIIGKPWRNLLHELNSIVSESMRNQVGQANSLSEIDDPTQVVGRLREAVKSTNLTSTSTVRDRDELDKLFDLMPVGVITLDKNLKVNRVNQQGLSMLGMQRKQLQDQDFSEQVKFEVSQGTDINRWLLDCRDNKIKSDGHWPDVQYSTLQNDKRYFEIFIHYSKGEENEFVITLTDHTEQQLSEDRKVDFIAIAAHELRAPITVIRGYMQVFEDELGSKLNEEQKEFMNKMNVSAAQLAGFINNILSVARIERDHIPVNLEKDDWRNIIIEACTDLSIRAEAHNRHMKLIVPKELPPVAVDRASIVHVINNLVDNAIKYTRDDDTIIVRVGVSQEGMIQTEIEDHGIGIPTSLIGSLFTKFYRSHRSKKQFGGTGLGLFLSKTIIDSHYGSIWARSKEGEGSTFAFALPPYDSVAEKIKKANNGMAEGIIRKEHGWIKNHSLYRG